ncbi:MAG: phosphoribosylglycinamide formyltransferase [Gammaproteobacteria bacterium]|nr:phosphoribosylglycinamide formyltransferase [Gammaproteobacteria bacterium]
MSTPDTLPTVILVSGRGSNLQAILQAAAAPSSPLEVRAVISNRPDAPALAVARAAGIPTQTVDHTTYPDRQHFDAALQTAIDCHAPALVVLAGFMRILGPEFVNHYRGRMLNIHPSLLPAYPGLDTHRRVLMDGVQEHGASVHFVTPAVDGGPVVLQARVPVLPDDTVTTLAARVLEQEHCIYPQALRWFAEGRLRLAGAPPHEYALLDDKPVGTEPVARTQGL